MEDPASATLHAEMKDALAQELERTGDEFLPWQEQVRHSGVIDGWNLREIWREVARRMDP